MVCFIGYVFTAWSQDYDITKFGVSADSIKVQTGIIQKVIDMASKNGGGSIVVPKGVYLSGALFFKPKIKLVLQEGAVLKGSDNIADYPLIPSRMEGQNQLYYADITFSNINVKSNRVGDIKGNPTDNVSNILFKNVTVKAAEPTLTTNKYPNIRTENVTVNGSSFIVK